MIYFYDILKTFASTLKMSSIDVFIKISRLGDRVVGEDDEG